MLIKIIGDFEEQKAQEISSWANHKDQCFDDGSYESALWLF